MCKKWNLSAIAAAAVTAVAGISNAAPFTPGNIVIEQVGLSSSSTALTSGATPVVLSEYTATGTLVQQVVMSHGTGTAPTSGNRFLVDSGTATSEGNVALSGNQHYLTVTGYNANDAATGVASSSSATNARVVGLVKYDGTADTSTVLGTDYSGNNVRSAVTMDGNEFWTAGAGGATGSVRYYSTVGGTTSGTAMNSSNTRQITINNGQLYASGSAGTLFGVATVGTGLPIAASTPVTLIAGSSTTGPDSTQFFFANPNTLYIADGRATTGSGGLQKWVLSGGTWTLKYTLSAGLPTSTAGLNGVTGTVTGGTANLFVVTRDGKTVAVVNDPIAATTASATFSTISSTAGTNFAFRTVANAPSPISLLSSDTPTLGSVSVAGNTSTGFVVTNKATGGVFKGVLDITGALATASTPVLIYLDLANDSSASALVSAINGSSGVTATAGTYDFGTGITYDVALTYTSNPSLGSDFYFDFDFTGITGGAVAVNNIAVVPEPVGAAMAIALIAIPLLGRRRQGDFRGVQTN